MFFRLILLTTFFPLCVTAAYKNKFKHFTNAGKQALIRKEFKLQRYSTTESTNHPVGENKPKKVTGYSAHRVKNSKNYIKGNSLGPGNNFTNGYFRTVQSPFEKSEARNYSIKGEGDQGQSIHEQIKDIIRSMYSFNKDVNDLIDKRTKTIRKMTLIIELLIGILSGTFIYEVHNLYTEIEIDLTNSTLEWVNAHLKSDDTLKSFPLLLNHSFGYDCSQLSDDQINELVTNFTSIKDNYDYKKVTQEFYTALADAFKQKHIKAVTPDDILNLIEETENILKEGTFKDAVCIDKKMNPLATLYLKQTTQLLKGENAYILGTVGFIQKLKHEGYSKNSYFIRKLNAPWWKKPFIFFRG